MGDSWLLVCLAGHWSRRRCVPVGLLATVLLLSVSLVSLVALGTCYWQVTHQLQNITVEQATERDHFAKEEQVWEQNLKQTQQELAWVQEELQQAWQEARNRQQELASREAELVHVSGALNATQKELQDVQGKLRDSKEAASSLRVCLNADCCPSGWLLYRGKCLFISAMKKSWSSSSLDCQVKQSHLLSQGDWASWMLPVSKGAAAPQQGSPHAAPVLLATMYGDGTHHVLSSQRFLQASSAMYWIKGGDYYDARRLVYMRLTAVLHLNLAVPGPIIRRAGSPISYKPEMPFQLMRSYLEWCSRQP
uniref:B-cell differentiation antigen CD72-like n=1 Tax=Coturnix japonica TaxID=93934 RepID=A0A8C2T344_COTJA